MLCYVMLKYLLGSPMVSRKRSQPRDYVLYFLWDILQKAISQEILALSTNPNMVID